jgi:uncharacterized protein with von Willebrand factor type A (vWA) domain
MKLVHGRPSHVRRSENKSSAQSIFARSAALPTRQNGGEVLLAQKRFAMLVDVSICDSMSRGSFLMCELSSALVESSERVHLFAHIAMTASGTGALVERCGRRSTDQC